MCGIYNAIFTEAEAGVFEGDLVTVVYYDDMHIEHIGRDAYQESLASGAVSLGVVTSSRPKFENNMIKIELRGRNLIILRSKYGNAYLYYKGGEVSLNGVILDRVYMDMDLCFEVEFMYCADGVLEVYTRVRHYSTKYCLRFKEVGIDWYSLWDLPGYTVLSEKTRLQKEETGSAHMGIPYWGDRQYVLSV